MAGTERDLRIDFVRGLALIFIFIDHVPDNVLAHFTLRNFGFADAAEVFVVLGGFSAVLAYSSTFERQGFRAGLGRVLARVRKIYLWHLILLFTCVIGLMAASRIFSNPAYVHNIGLAIFHEAPARAVALSATLVNQPNSLNILPLYVVVFLFWLPFLLWLIPRQPLGALLLSAAVWAVSNVFTMNLPSHQHTGGWVFNPLAWQLLVTIGALTARAHRARTIPFTRPLILLAAGYLTFAFVVAAPWRLIPGLDGYYIVPRDLLGHMDKTYLSPWRLLNIVALGYLILSLMLPQSSLLMRPATIGIGRCGRFALEIFCLGTVLSFAGWVIFSEVGNGPALQILVNGAGIGILWGAAWYLAERSKGSAAVRALQPSLASSSSARRLQEA